MERQSKNRQRIGCLLMAYLCTHSISYLMNLRGGVPFSHSVWTLFLWVGITVCFLYTLERWRRETDVSRRRRRICFAGGFSLLFGVLLAAGYQLQWQGYTDPGFVGKGKLLLRGILVGAAVLPAVDFVFARLDSRRTVGGDSLREGGDSSAAAGQGKPWRSLSVFLGSFLGIWLCWIPVWLAYYPAIMSYDFHKQSLEAFLGPQYFNNHHPLAHTWLIYVFRSLGEKIGSYETGFALFCLFQQLIAALVLGYACVMIYRLTGKKRAVLVSALFWGCFPLVSVFVMCTTKDVLFGAFFVLFLLLFAEHCRLAGRADRQGKDGEKTGERRGEDGEKTGKKVRVAVDILWVLSGVLMMLFRNNALYAMLVFGVFFILLSGRKQRLYALVLTILLIAGGKGALTGLQCGFHAHSGSEIEKYSVIYQSMARVGKMQRGNLSEETFALLDTYVTQECWEDYNPPLADTIKSPVQKINFNQKKSWNDMGEVLRAWLKIGLQYPNEYIDAFLDLTRGYWFLDDTSHAEMLGVGAEERMGLLYTYNSAAEESLPGIQHISKFPWLEGRLESLLSENSYYRFPVIANFFKPALWCWFLVFCAFYTWYSGERKKFLMTLYPLCYFATMLLGPTAIIRYVFPFILFAPVLLAMVSARDFFR